MFTGLISILGTLERHAPSTGTDQKPRDDEPMGDIRLWIAARAEPPWDVGESVAVNGVCLTVVNPSEDGFAADCSPETLARTTLGTLASGETVHLERALCLGDRLGGHLVSGHVDGRGTLTSRAEPAQSGSESSRQQPTSRQESPVAAGDLREHATVMTFRAPPTLAGLIAEKGSIAIDGVSLTVNQVHGRQFSITVVPHTAKHTRFGTMQPGTAVNLEVDLLARYVARLLGPIKGLRGNVIEDHKAEDDSSMRWLDLLEQQD